MSQHFLLSAQARTLSLCNIFSLSDDQAFEMFKQSRWGHHDTICPCCQRCQALFHQDPPPMALPRLQSHLLGHVRHDLRQPQATVEGLPRRHRYLLQCSERLVGTATGA